MEELLVAAGGLAVAVISGLGLRYALTGSHRQELSGILFFTWLGGCLVFFSVLGAFLLRLWGA